MFHDADSRKSRLPNEDTALSGPTSRLLAGLICVRTRLNHRPCELPSPYTPIRATCEFVAI